MECQKGWSLVLDAPFNPPDRWSFLRGREDVVLLLQENDELRERIAYVEAQLSLWQQYASKHSSVKVAYHNLLLLPRELDRTCENSDF